MFGIFKRKSELEKLQDSYKKIMEEAFKLQSINRTDSDKKYYEADMLMKKIESLQSKQ
ncbi:Lacal_2735 family protein [Polaribacter sp. L3A8]|uniref:Lacal_2735 family protein n=1 Tax=Polaribacter sp. L3A8 TaxID=2686361 RepID=UPI00131E8C73|nr:Lacal_2735 family protein [Polaribacter sp. L3A8]